MSDLYTELLIKRETPSGEKAMKVAMIVVTVLAGVAGVLVNPLLLILFLGMCVLDYFKFPAFDLEFEYLYVNGELDIDKIMSKQKRKAGRICVYGACSSWSPPVNLMSWIIIVRTAASK